MGVTFMYTEILCIIICKLKKILIILFVNLYESSTSVDKNNTIKNVSRLMLIGSRSLQRLPQHKIIPKLHIFF